VEELKVFLRLAEGVAAVLLAVFQVRQQELQGYVSLFSDPLTRLLRVRGGGGGAPGLAGAPGAAKDQ
jgi:hypothetical protein